MEPPLPGLKLIISKGPRSGETLEFKAGSLIRIGRVKRGNTFSINEDGISSKHLSIESKSGKWTLQDLNSSNGTILKSTDLHPNTPVDLHEDDTIKIGEETAILVKFAAVAEEEPPPRRNPRRQVNARVTRSQMKNEKVAENLETKVEEAAAEEEKEKEGRVTRRGRGRRTNLPELPAESGLVEVEVVSGGDDEEKMKCEEVKEKASQLTRKGRGRRRNLQEMPLESGHVQIEGETSGSRVTRKGRGTRKNLPEVPLERSPVQVDNNENLRSEEVGGVSIGVKEGGDRVEEKVGSSVEEKGPNLEKMTLGEWFDYMEVYLPKLIMKETEEMIEGTKRKAEKVHEYMKQQRKEKGKL